MQEPNFGVTVYVNVAGVFVVLTKFWPIFAWLLAKEPPVIAPTGLLIGVGHEYNVPVGTIVCGD